MKKIFIDAGSSTVKIYFWQDGKLDLALQKSITFKDGFDPAVGISNENKEKLFELMTSVKNNNAGEEIKIFATGIFRKLSPETRDLFVGEFKERMGIDFNIISQEQENIYLEKALIGQCSLPEPILLINIGGGSTELVLVCNGAVVERKNVDLGVGTVNTKFSEINNPVSGVGLEGVLEYITVMLPELSSKVKIAFYTGGELNYMQLAGYPLEKNNLFEDNDHPVFILTSNFAQKNKKIYTEIKLSELEALMPDNPKWMHGARGCSAIAQAICEKYGVEKIIPSNSNLINGVVRDDT